MNFRRSLRQAGVVKLLGGAASGQLVALLAYPILTRLYAPDEMGTLSVFTSLVGILAVGASLTFDQAIPLPREDRDATGLLRLSLIAATGSAALVLLTMVLVPGDFLPVPSGVRTLFSILVPLGVWLVAVNLAYSMFALRLGHYGRMGSTRLLQAASGAAVQIAGGLTGLGPLSLMTGYLLGRSAGSIILARGIRAISNQRCHFSFREYRCLFVRYKRFAYFGVPSGLVNAGATQLPVTLIASTFGLSAAGFFGLAVLMLSAPVELVGRSGAQVFYSESAAAWHENPASVRPKLVRITLRLLAVSAVPMLGVAFFGEWAVGAIFGTAWTRTGTFAALLAPAYLAALVAWPASQLYLLLQRQGLLLLLNCLRLSISVLTLGVLPFAGFDIELSLLLFSLATTVYQVVLILVAHHLLAISAERSL